MRIKVLTRIIVFAVATCATSIANGGLIYRSQERFVEGRTETDIPMFEHKSAPGFGPFAATAFVNFIPEVGDSGAGVTLTQRSSLGKNSLFAAGSFDAGSGGGIVDYHTRFHVIFEVTDPVHYDLSTKLDLSDFTGGGFHTVTEIYGVKLTRVGQMDPLFQTSLLGTEGFAPLHIHDRRTGTLENGRYDLKLDVGTTLTIGGQVGTYDLRFATRPVVAAVPLPPAAFTGLLLLAMLALGKWFLARRQRMVAG